MSEMKSDLSFLDQLEKYAASHDFVLFRYGYGDFMELKPEFVLECIKEFRVKMISAVSGLDGLSALDRLAFYVLEEAAENM